MAIGILAAVLGVLVAAASIGIPQVIRHYLQRNNDDEEAARAYLESTGRTAKDIARENASQLSGQGARDAAGGGQGRAAGGR